MSLNLQQWYPRKAQHPWYQTHSYIIDIFPAITGAKCLALLPIYQNTFNKNAQKILNGMLGMLELTQDELVIAKIYSKNILTNNDWQQVYNEIDLWQPQFILQLDPQEYIKKPHIICTYSPMYLQEHQEAKKIAYNSLVSLRQHLSHAKYS